MNIHSKISYSLMALVLTFFIAVALNSFYMSSLKTNLEAILDVHVANSDAAMEMEINLIGTGFGLLGYLHDHDPKHLARMKKDKKDFVKFMKMSALLTKSEEAKVLDAKISQHYQEFSLRADELVELQSGLDKDIQLIEKVLDEIDSILDEQIQQNINIEDPQALEKTRAAMEMEINTNGLVKGLGSYLWTPEPKYVGRVEKDTSDFRHFLSIYEKLDLSEEEKRWAVDVRQKFEFLVTLSSDMMQINRQKKKKLAEFVNLRREMDTLLDDGIQFLTQRAIYQSRTSAIEAIENNTRAGLLIVVFCMILAWVLAMYIVRNTEVRQSQ